MWSQLLVVWYSGRLCWPGEVQDALGTEISIDLHLCTFTVLLFTLFLSIKQLHFEYCLTLMAAKYMCLCGRARVCVCVCVGARVHVCVHPYFVFPVDCENVSCKYIFSEVSFFGAWCVCFSVCSSPNAYFHIIWSFFISVLGTCVAALCSQI